MNIVFFSHSSWDENLVVGSHHLVQALAAGGHNVWHVGPPVTAFHLLRLSNRGYRERLFRSFRARAGGGGLTSLEPFSLVPWQVARWFLPWGNSFIRCSNLVRKLRSVSGPAEIDLLIVDDPRFTGAEAVLKPKAFFYRPTDLYAEMKGDPAFLTAERQLLARCAGVIATSRLVLLHALTLRPGLPHLLLQNGVNYEHFSTPAEEPEELRSIPHPRVVYVGAIDFRFDAAMVVLLADRLPRVHFVLIGPAGEWRRSNHRPNIHILGAKPHGLVPGFLQFSDAGILPFTDLPVNTGRSPMKFYEYGAAGLPVLARRTEELEGRREQFAHFYSTADEAVESLERILEATPDRRRIAESCRSQSWTNKVAALLEFVSQYLPAGATRGTPIGKVS
jgi:glycosyltransferase involved in cell wall biosynthesis